MWFSKVPGYIFDKQKTPYLTEAKDLTLAQSQYELAAYGVFVGIKTIPLYPKVLQLTAKP